MKKNLFVLVLLFTAVNTWAQSPGIEKLITGLQTIDIFKNCVVFKNDVNSKMLQVRSMNLDPDKFNQLRLSYTDLYKKYDDFLKTIKADLMNISNVKELISRPEMAAQSYAAKFQEIKEVYENSFLIHYNSLQPSDAKAFPIGVLLKFGFDAFKVIVNTIKSNRLNKDDAINLLLPHLNNKLFNKLKINTWSQLNIPGPADSKIEEEIIIPQKTLDALHGHIAFLQNPGPNEDDLPMLFAAHGDEKDLHVVTDTEENITETNEYFTTIERYPIGAKFRVQLVNAGFTYILALNTNGIVLLHPTVQTLSFPDAKDITVSGDETPRTGSVTVPTGKAGRPSYFAITKNVEAKETSAEELAILLSKSELVVEEIIEKLNAVSGNLSERITQVFGKKKIKHQEANISMQDGTIVFDANNSSHHLLPLVFKILKQ